MKSVILIWLCTISIYAQKDSLVRYNIETKTLTYYSPVIYDASVIFENTGWNYGSEPGFQPLNLTPPENTFPVSGFTDYLPAQNFYSVNNFPIRSAVKIFFINNDSIKQKCSGLLVEKNYVLTDCHCIGVYDSNQTFQFQDSLIVMPAFDNGEENQIFGKIMAEEYYTFSSNMSDFWKKDIALIKLKDDPGTKTGWMGIAFSEDVNFYKNNVFHKLSYPGTVDLSDSSRIFNGDTLFYNYGVLDYINSTSGKPGSFGYNIEGIRGQSGSSLFYTDNTAYYSIGTLVWSSNSNHIRISPEIYYSFKSVLNGTISDVPDDEIIPDNFYISEIYPNPFNPAARINYILTEQTPVNITVYNTLGQQAAVLINETQKAGIYTVEFNGSSFSSGVYYIRVSTGKYTEVRKAVMIK